MEFLKNGGALLQAQIDRAAAEGRHELTFSGNYEIERTVLLPSDFALTLSDCHLRMAEGTFCNLFTNRNARTPEGRTDAGADRNITLRGVGRAILDGGVYNGLCEGNSLKEGRPHISVNNLLLFANVQGFRVEGLHCRNQRWWALNFIDCANGYIGNIDFLADYHMVDEAGGVYDGIFHGVPGRRIRVYNADGIDIRSGCHDILIENITGFTQDDTVACTALYWTLEELFCVPGHPRDIHNIVIRNVLSQSSCTNVRLLNQGGCRLYNILVDGVMDASAGSPYMDRGINGVRIGDNHLYGSRHATAEETFNLTVKNVYSRADAALRLAGAMRDCCFENINGFDGCRTRIADDATVDVSGYLK